VEVPLVEVVDLVVFLEAVDLVATLEVDLVVSLEVAVVAMAVSNVPFKTMPYLSAFIGGVSTCVWHMCNLIILWHPSLREAPWVYISVSTP
jgi:hypothetical protein